MRQLQHLASALAAAALTFSAVAAPAQPPKAEDKGGVGSMPASSAEIVSAIGDCVRFVKHHGQVDHDGLKAAGWQFGGKQEQPARGPMPATTQIYLGKGNIIIVLQLTGVSAGCQTIGRVKDIAQAAEVRTGIMQAHGAKLLKEYKGDEAFKSMMVRQVKPEQLDNMLISDADRFTINPIDKGETKLVTIMMIPRILD